MKLVWIIEWGGQVLVITEWSGRHATEAWLVVVTSVTQTLRAYTNTKHEHAAPTQTPNT